ncbi:helix-turn-helix domain-containing protein [Carboxylicivirga sediminis]|uniref:Helix-turn-helix domain-containing protein n=1 Tax=Carboxylicivirga sediminis TaxID=2006564 RepID=A0A941F2E0_9BACT|nr:AraC family transcriptional regulator [Carboxylicivirga sediminis]MBR8535518.1 helix-turn-helix domain-containing protein [Carboxylicivirga sediminis]
MHNEIKTYDLTQTDGASIDFIIKSTADIFEQLQGHPEMQDHPHRHNYFTIILVEDNPGGVHIIDFKEYPLNGPSIHFVYPGQVHQFLSETSPKGYVLNFSRTFLMKNGIPDELIDRVYLYNTFGDSPPMPVNQEQLTVFSDIIRQMQQYQQGENYFRYEALGALLKLFIINISGACSLSKLNTEYDTGSNRLIRDFKKLIESNYQQSHKVQDYAEQLAVSADYLNRYVKSKTGKSAKEYIQDKLMIEAKRLLLFTELSGKELAYELGFEEPSHFNAFFKKVSGFSPIAFRQEVRQ